MTNVLLRPFHPGIGNHRSRENNAESIGTLQTGRFLRSLRKNCLTSRVLPSTELSTLCGGLRFQRISGSERSISGVLPW